MNNKGQIVTLDDVNSIINWKQESINTITDKALDDDKHHVLD